MKSALIFLWVMTPILCWADAADELKIKLDGMKSLTGQFRQELKDKQGEVLQASEGDFILKRPGYFLWQSAAPFEQTVVGTPEKIWVYDPDLEQVTIRTQHRQDETSPAAIISGDVGRLRELFEIAKVAGKKEEKFILTPRTTSSTYKSMSFLFVKNNLEGLTFVDKLDQSTVIDFQKTQLNTAVSDEKFVFLVPEGVDVIVDE